MEFGQRTQYYAVGGHPAQDRHIGFRPGVFDEGLVNDPEQVGPRRQQGQAFVGRAEQPRRVAGIGQKHRRTRGRFGKPGQQIAGRLPVRTGTDAAPERAAFQPGKAAGQRVFAERRFDDGNAGCAAPFEYAGEGVDELVASVAEGEAAGGQAVSACRSGKGLLGVGRRVGREARIRPDQRGTEELRRAFGADVYAEIKQGRGIALGHRRHGEKVAAVCIELHKEPRSVVEMGAPPPGRMGIPFFSADSAARIQAAQSSGLVRVVSTTIWLGRGR